ncbi:hypothetical protein EDD80_11831 [Anseongella ginsenosidimutans]|uniref:AAA domain-containing protein n=1 Tax=Anseongella ginsenosidimutans TaxID=496056 RepID=A0A4R3KL96_9SPHI|nr:hypothetical protein [Anseongella ginsenosidimutans]QEC51973.1 hypothetical protein FRZ59_06260 [Anseongella ginsenosidimutans]TCS84762.1 hypothetical protein EDD80_11831 [Anseongella ginsenosidimutans]
MKTTLYINSVLVYSERNNKFFYTKFKDRLNVIYGKNTSGKSTLIQLLLFAFGINDNKIKLAEILSEEIFVRLDCTVTRERGCEPYVFLRQDETLFIREKGRKVLRFNGISGDSSAEHIKLKKYFSKLFNFGLQLESNSGVSEAPIETIFLPYYISQEVGWVYLRKSFTNLNFYKNFKEDFLDYYLGIESALDREEKRKIERNISRLNSQIKFFTEVERDSPDFKLANAVTKALNGKANQLLVEITGNKEKLMDLENDYVDNSNKLTFYSKRLAVVSKVKRNHQNQEPGKDNCPTCNQILPSGIENAYAFFQEGNDTIALKKDLKEKIKQTQSTLNALSKKIEIKRSDMSASFKIFNRYSEEDVTLEKYIDHRVNIQLLENLNKQIGQLTLELETERERLKDYKTEDEILFEREKKNKVFKDIYSRYISDLGLPNVSEDRFSKLYDISSFPFQGVHLHLAVMSYHFAFNYLITDTVTIHRLPFILDSIFKEDVEGGNRIKILNFINANFPRDTQTILSIADDSNIDSRIGQYKADIFKDNAHMICIGNGTEERALLKSNDDSQKALIEDSFEILEAI